MTIVDKLRDRAYSTKAGDELCEEAAALIESLTWRDKVKDNIINRLTTEIGRLRNGAAESRETVRSDGPRSTTHDAAPAAIARDADRGRTDKAVTRPGDGTGNTPSEAEIDALEFVVEEGRTASVDDYGILRSWLIRLRPAWEHQSYEESDEKRTNTNTNRDTTPGQGSVRDEGALTDAEQQALEFAIETGRVATHDAATLRKLLERLK
jgi:hypothetical protein